jgi:hypothetical protein
MRQLARQPRQGGAAGQLAEELARYAAPTARADDQSIDADRQISLFSFSVSLVRLSIS